MTDQFLEGLPVLSDATGAVVYGVKGSVDYQIPTSVIQNSINPQAANLVYAGPTTAPGDFPEFRLLVPADIPDLSSLYLASTGGSLSTATISNSTFTGGTISGATITVNDNAFTVRDQTDTTKRFQFEASGIAAGNTRVFTMPDASTTVVGTDATQTLTNKIVRTSIPTTAAAPLRVPHGSAPTSPVNGDMWTTTAGLYVRVNSATVGPLAAATGSSVNSFNGRVGTVTLTNSDVTTALGFTPANSSTAALDADVVHDTGNETIAGVKTFSSTISGSINGNAATLNGISVTAGNGLTGGGALSASRTITLGTPSSITGTSTNSVSTSSHTHTITTLFDSAFTDIVDTYPQNIPTLGTVTGGPMSTSTHLTWNFNNTRVGQLLTTINGGSQIPEIYFRTSHTSAGGGGWTDAYKIWHEGTFNPSNYATLSGASFTGAISVNGSITATAGNITSLQNFIGGTNVVLAGNGGVIYLRPNGSTTSTGQTTIDSAGGMSVSGTLSSNGNLVMDASWSITAGNGLTGGGTGALSRTITMGTPGSLTGSTANAVTTTSHTHAITVDLGISGTTAARTITNSAGTTAIIPVATASASGLVSTAAQTWGGVKTAPNFVASSDARLKRDIVSRLPAERLADMLRFVEYFWKDSGDFAVGVIAQEVRAVAPEYVYEDVNGLLAVDKAGLALECVIGLAARVRDLEKK